MPWPGVPTGSRSPAAGETRRSAFGTRRRAERRPSSAATGPGSSTWRSAPTAAGCSRRQGAYPNQPSNGPEVKLWDYRERRESARTMGLRDTRPRQWPFRPTAARSWRGTVSRPPTSGTSRRARSSATSKASTRCPSPTWPSGPTAGCSHRQRRWHRGPLGCRHRDISPNPPRPHRLGRAASPSHPTAAARYRLLGFHHPLLGSRDRPRDRPAPRPSRRRRRSPVRPRGHATPLLGRGRRGQGLGRLARVRPTGPGGAQWLGVFRRIRAGRADRRHRGLEGRPLLGPRHRTPPPLHQRSASSGRGTGGGLQPRCDGLSPRPVHTVA